MQKNVTANQITLEIWDITRKCQSDPKPNSYHATLHISPSPWIESGPVYITKPGNKYGQLIIYSLSDITERTRITKYPVMPMTP